MNGIKEFLEELLATIDIYLPDCSIQYILRTSKSLKANIIINKDTFVAIRYNSRNNRKDYALIEHDKRILGYDNLKGWHIHPLQDPETHLECEEPSIEKVFVEIKEHLSSKGIRVIRSKR